MLLISELYIYPIKSLGGIQVNSAFVTSRGFKFDRRWMLVDQHHVAITQREAPVMALLQVHITVDGLRVTHKNKQSDPLQVSFLPENEEQVSVSLFGEVCQGQFVSTSADNWFSRILSAPCRLVYMPETSVRKVDDRYAFNNDITSFSDGYPYLLIGQSSLDDLNSRLSEPVPMNRFRPNIVFTGGLPYQEDDMQHFMINNIQCFGVKPCARCVITTIDQDTARKAKDPLKTLATYRSKNKMTYFGQNLLMHREGEIKVGDEIIW